MNYETKLESGQQLPADDFASAEASGGDELRTSRKRRLIIAALIAFVLLIAAAFMLSSGGEEEAFAPESDGTTPTVTVIAPGRTTIEGVINATGTLAARRAMPVGVVGEGGLVASVRVEQGDYVSAGQVLAVIDRSVQNRQLESQSAQIEIAQADAELARANLNRSLQLVERGFVSQADVDRLTATRDAANARVRLAQAQLRELQARNARLNIVAPAAGLVLERNIEPGQVVGAGSGVLFSIARGGEMELLANLGESDLAKVTVGSMADVVPVGTDKSFPGQIWQLEPTINQTNRQGIARIALGAAPELRPGGFASVRINSGTVVAPMLPESAILSDANGSYVYIVGKDNKVERRPVQLGAINGGGIAIASGLDGSEKIVVRAGGFLSAGEVIRPILAENAE